MSASVAAPMASTALDLRRLRVMEVYDHVGKNHAYPAAWTHRIPMSRPIVGKRDAPMDPPTKSVIDTRYTTYGNFLLSRRHGVGWLGAYLSASELAQDTPEEWHDALDEHEERQRPTDL